MSSVANGEYLVTCLGLGIASSPNGGLDFKAVLTEVEFQNISAPLYCPHFGVPSCWGRFTVTAVAK